jgi:hypothetical protein
MFTFILGPILVLLSSSFSLWASETYDDLLTDLTETQATYLEALEKGEDTLPVQKKLADLNLKKLKLEKKLRADSHGTAPSSLSYRGHFQFRTEGARNVKGEQGRKQEDQSLYRLRTYLAWKANPNLEFNLTPQAAKGFGANDASKASTSGSSVHTELFFFEANVRYSLRKDLDVKIGKQEIAYGDHLVIGTSPWDNSGRSFDAVKIRHQHRKGWTDLVYSKIDDDNTPARSADDVNLAILYNSWSLGPELKALDFYLINLEDHRTEGLEVNMAGMRLKGERGKIFYRTETGAQAGRKLGNDAYQVDVETGVNFLGQGLSVEYSRAGKDYRQLYPTAHRYLGFADVLGRRNIEQFAVHLFTPVTDQFWFTFTQHFFRRHSTGESAYKLNGATSWGRNGDSKDIGREFDLTANLKTKDSLHLQLGASLFTPGEYLRDQNSDQGKDTRFLYAQLIFDF